jgi:RHS repeat-associated protein
MGGLLAIRSFPLPMGVGRGEGSTAFPCFDANGNLTDLVSTNSASAAHYEYDPYGNTLAATGPLATANPVRFSSKYTDDETGLLYYGYRYYSPGLGRWVNRDPIEEEGGLNIYVTCNNEMITVYDVLGREWREYWGISTAILGSWTDIDGNEDIDVRRDPTCGCDDAGSYRASFTATHGWAKIRLISEGDRSHEAKHVNDAKTLYYQPWDQFLTGRSKCFRTETAARDWANRVADKSWNAYADGYRGQTILRVDVPDIWQFYLVQVNLIRAYYLINRSIREFQELLTIL